jgi:hypothetical protein
VGLDPEAVLALRVARVDLDARGPVTLERWQLRDVVDGHVSEAAMTTHLVAQAFARDGKRLTVGGLALALSALPEQTARMIETLRAAGWWSDDGVLVATRVARAGPAAAPAPAPPVAIGEAPPSIAQPVLWPEPPAEPQRPVAKRRPSPSGHEPAGSRAAVEVLAADLCRGYPHGANSHGRSKDPGKTPVARALQAVFNGCPRADRESLEAAIRAGCAAEAAVAPAEGDPERRWVPTLTKWIADRSWENPPKFQRAPADPRAPIGGGGAEARARPRPARQGPDWARAPEVDGEAARERLEREIRERHQRKLAEQGGGP